MRLVLLLVPALVLTACTSAAPTEPAASPSASGTTPRALPLASPAPTATPPAPTEDPAPAPAERAAADAATRPAWLGTRVLPDGPQGWPEPVDTPPELVDRRLPPPEEVLPPPDDDGFVGTVATASDDVLARSTWSPDCPVAAADLAHVVVTFFGFDEQLHTGELLVHRDVADDVVEVFRRLHEAHFPLEEVRIITDADLDAPPTGDGNVSGSFVCRPTRGSTSWSSHARGLAVDINPFHNPYERDGRVLPELATAYLDRDWHRPGMILDGDVVTTAFAELGWTWGGDFTSLTDPMHFSRDGR